MLAKQNRALTVQNVGAVYKYMVYKINALSAHQKLQGISTMSMCRVHDRTPPGVLVNIDAEIMQQVHGTGAEPPVGNIPTRTLTK